MPELVELELPNNGLKGGVHQCFQALTTLDLSGNEFDAVATQSLEAP